eukprot:8095945-Pyramimonas_sp.AAC.1
MTCALGGGRLDLLSSCHQAARAGGARRPRDCKEFGRAPFEVPSGWQRRGLEPSTVADLDPDIKMSFYSSQHTDGTRACLAWKLMRGLAVTELRARARRATRAPEG